MRNSAKKAMTTKGQKACYIIDHLVDALAYHSSSSVRRAIILVDIHENPGTTAAEIMTRMDIGKSALSREIDWLFNYGCVRRAEAANDARKIKLEVCGYAVKHVEGALDYFEGEHESLKNFLESTITLLGGDKPSLRDAKIVATLFVKGGATKQEIVDSLYDGSPATENRAIMSLIEEGIIEDAAA